MLPVLDLRELGARARRALPDRPDNVARRDFRSKLLRFLGQS